MLHVVAAARGIFFKMEFPYAHFGTLGVTGNILFPIIWEAVQQIEGLGLKVICIVADSASSNRKFICMNGKVGSPLPTYKTLNLYASEERSIYFISDPPHLIKTTRNCLSNSSTTGTRHMEVCCN